MTRLRRLHPQEFNLLAQARHAATAHPPPPAGRLPTVTLSVLSCNRWRLTRRCLESILANTPLPYDLIVWDNCSRPETVAALRAFQVEHPHMTLVCWPENLGCGWGRNRSAALATTDFIFFLDNDIICLPGWLEAALEVVNRYQADCVAPLLLNPDRTTWMLGAELARTEGETVLEIARWFHDLPAESLDRLLEGGDFSTNYCPGSGLYRLEAFRRCGGFPDFQAGYEDLAFSLRLVELGYTTWTAQRSMLIHDNDWRAEDEGDVAYARRRFDLDRLRQDAERFKNRWGMEVLPAKYVTSIARRLQSKLPAAGEDTSPAGSPSQGGPLQGDPSEAPG